MDEEIPYKYNSIREIKICNHGEERKKKTARSSRQETVIIPNTHARAHIHACAHTQKFRLTQT